MKKRTIPTLFLLLLVLLSSLRLPAEAVDGGQRRQTLQGKTLLILGDSYCAGYGLERREDAWPYQMAEQWDMDYIDHAISGSTFASGSQSSAPMVERVEELTGTLSLYRAHPTTGRTISRWGKRIPEIPKPQWGR